MMTKCKPAADSAWYVVAFGSEALAMLASAIQNNLLTGFLVVAFGSDAFTSTARPYITAYLPALQIHAVAFEPIRPDFLTE
jgi:hypothetical protein